MVFGIVFSLLLLTFVAYRGYSVILFAPVCTILAILFSPGTPIMPELTEVFMAKGMLFAKAYFPLFLLGAIFGKLMEMTGMAKSIANGIIIKLGERYTILSVVLSCAILAYGGVSVFVVAFSVYPLGAAIFKEGGIPKRLLPGAIALGSFTFAMTALPGTPQIQNLIPVKYFGTTAYAAPTLGIIGGTAMFVFGMLWLERRKTTLISAGEGYGSGHVNEPDENVEFTDLVNPLLALLPLLLVFALNFFLTKQFINIDSSYIEEYEVKAKSIAAIWALMAALTGGIIVTILIGWKKLFGGGFKAGEPAFIKGLNVSVDGSLVAIMNTAAVVGFGAVVSRLEGFKKVADFLLGIDFGTPLVSEAFSINVLAGITGSASGGMSIALEAMGQFYMDWAARVNLDPELLHRVASLSSGGLDSLPHSGAIITLLAICGLSHKKSYFDIGMVATVIPFITTFTIILLSPLFL